MGFLFMLFPFLNTLRDYTVKEDLVSDLIAGLTVGVMHVPQGLCTSSMVDCFLKFHGKSKFHILFQVIQAPILDGF